MVSLLKLDSNFNLKHSLLIRLKVARITNTWHANPASCTLLLIITSIICEKVSNRLAVAGYR